MQLDSLKQLITTYMMKNLSEENMLVLYALAWKYNIRTVCEKTSKAISMKIQKFVGRDEFNKMDVNFLKALLSNPYLQSSNETQYCKIVLQWFQYDRENREQYFDEVMSL